jgi:catechol 2,3-dioxygenase-like lactoylglutathione lyase family enzyme
VKLDWPCWIGIVADDLESQRRFYRDTLGIKEVRRGPDWVHFDLGEGNLFELIRRSEDSQYDRPRYQVGFAVADIEAARAELIARGVSAITPLEGGADTGGRWCYFRDPEGNVFEIKERPR